MTMKWVRDPATENYVSGDYTIFRHYEDYPKGQYNWYADGPDGYDGGPWGRLSDAKQRVEAHDNRKHEVAVALHQFQEELTRTAPAIAQVLEEFE
jgi:hypothetical protein